MTAPAIPAHDASSSTAGRVAAIVPVIDEEVAIFDVVRGLLANGVDDVIVVDGNSRDRTVERARTAGAEVVVETRRGYGQAMMTGISRLPDDAAIVLFFDGDGSDRTGLVPDVIAPIVAGTADFVHGTRTRGEREPGSLGAVQIIAALVASLLLWLRYGARFSDMSPFRAITRRALLNLGMTETTFGWNLEMQMRAAASGLRIVEIPVGQRRRRGGVSKVSGSPLIALRAAWSIATAFFRLAATIGRPATPALAPVADDPQR